MSDLRQEKPVASNRAALRKSAQRKHHGLPRQSLVDSSRTFSGQFMSLPHGKRIFSSGLNRTAAISGTRLVW